MEEHYLRVLDNELECLDCVKEETTDYKNSSSQTNASDDGITIKSGDSINLKLNTKSLTTNGSEIEVKINEESGVEIKTKTKDN